MRFQKPTVRRRFLSLRAKVIILALLFLLSLTLTLTGVPTLARWRHAGSGSEVSDLSRPQKIGTDGHTSILWLPQSRMSIRRLELLPICPSCNTTLDDDFVASKPKIGVFLVINDTEGFLKTHEPRISGSFSCNTSYKYDVYVVYGSAAPSNELDSNDTRVETGIERMIKTSLQLCVSMRASVSVWIVNVSAAVNVINALNEILIEAYFDDVTWYDLLIWSDSRSHVRLRRTYDPIKILATQQNIGVVGEKLGCCGGRFFVYRSHFEILGHFFPMNNLTLGQSVNYLLGVYFPPYLQMRELAGHDTKSALKTVVPRDSGSDALTFDGRHNGIEFDAVNLSRIKRNTFDISTCNTSCDNDDLVIKLRPQARLVLNRYLEALSKSFGCLLCPTTTSIERRVITMSLYGADPKYLVGAVRNAQLLPVIFPGWQLWIYCQQRIRSMTYSVELEDYPVQPDSCVSVPNHVTRKLLELGADVKFIDPEGLAPMMWRFLPVDDPTVDVFISRDSDSRLSERDFAVISAWLAEGSPFHCVRDHPSHGNYPVSGGLWGARSKALKKILFGDRSIELAMKAYSETYLEDMKFLAVDIWPAIQSHAFCHDSVSCDKWPRSHPFPVARRGSEHLGQVHDAYSVPRQIDIDLLLQFRRNGGCEPERLS